MSHEIEIEELEGDRTRAALAEEYGIDPAMVVSPDALDALQGESATGSGDESLGEGEADSTALAEVPEGEAFLQWRDAVSWGIDLVHVAVMPNWTIDGKGRGLLIDSAAEKLAFWFPDGVGLFDLEKLPPHYKALAGLFLIALANLDGETKRLKPFVLVESEENNSESGAESAAGDEGQQESNVHDIKSAGGSQRELIEAAK